MTNVKPVPEGFSRATPDLVVDRGAEAIDFYARAFGVEVRRRLGADGMLVHAALRIGDAGAVHAPAVAAGATEVNPVADRVHSDRAGSVRDPFGHRCAIATRVEDVAPEEIERRMAELG